MGNQNCVHVSKKGREVCEQESKIPLLSVFIIQSHLGQTVTKVSKLDSSGVEKPEVNKLLANSSDCWLCPCYTLHSSYDYAHTSDANMECWAVEREMLLVMLNAGFSKLIDWSIGCDYLLHNFSGILVGVMRICVSDIWDKAFLSVKT